MFCGSCAKSVSTLIGCPVGWHDWIMQSPFARQAGTLNVGAVVGYPLSLYTSGTVFELI